MRRAAIRCRICGASCSCKNARDGICCPCHPHKGHKRAVDAQRAGTYGVSHELEEGRPQSAGTYAVAFEEAPR